MRKIAFEKLGRKILSCENFVSGVRAVGVCV